MAKQLVNPVERHLEKVVLAAAGLVLLGVAVKYLITSPTQLDLGGDQVSPSTIDQKLAEKAASVRDTLRRASVQEELPEPLYDDFVKALDPYEQAELPEVLPPALPPRPGIPIVDPPEAGAGRVDLATVVPLSNPAATHGRSEFIVNDQGFSRPEPANWVTVSAVFDVKAQMEQLQRQYGANRKDVIFGPIELQRRTRREDGSWNDEDWTNVEPWVPIAFPKPPTLTFVEEDGQVLGSPKDRTTVEDYFESLRTPATLQMDVLRPLLPEMRRGTPWTFPLITNRQDVLMQDDQYLHPNDPPSKSPLDRYSEEELTVQRAVELPPDKRIDKELKEIEEQLKSAWQNNSLNDCLRAYNRAFEIERDPEASRTQKVRAKELKERADLMEDDLKRRSGPVGPAQPAQAKEDAARQPYPTQQLWRHDARPGSVESSKSYQYRLRASIGNLLAGQPEKFRDPADGARIFIYGPWSDPVEVTIPPDHYYFVTSEDPRNHEVGIEFFRWFEGNWYRCPRRIRLGIGDKLYDAQRTPVQGSNPGEPERPTVVYEADAIAVDIDFERTYRERKRGAGRDGVTFGSPSETGCLVLMDSQGRLTERFVETDKRHPAKSEIKVWTPTRTD